MADPAKSAKALALADSARRGLWLERYCRTESPAAAQKISICSNLVPCFAALFADLARASVLELAPGAHLGVFRVVRELARGGMGVVYLAERDDGQYTQRVALKIVGSARVSNEVFKRERQILADLRHPNIARLVTADRFDPAGHGGDGTDRRRAAGPALPGAATGAARLNRSFLCDAVTLPWPRVLHRDLKPANVMVVPMARQLLDLHRRVDRRCRLNTLSRPVMPAGTVAWRSLMWPRHLPGGLLAYYQSLNEQRQR
jgi:serine/threonine protein kinase